MKIVSGVPAAIPVVGDFMVELLRGGESVGQSTLTRFYSLHTFVMPWLLAVFMLMHFDDPEAGHLRSLVIQPHPFSFKRTRTGHSNAHS